MERRSVADIEGAWAQPAFPSGLLEQLRENWNVPLHQVTNHVLATFIRQDIALALTVPEAERRLKAGHVDGSELYEDELPVVLAKRRRPGSLREEVARFQAWADKHYPPGARNGEWECGYDDWPQLRQAWLAKLASCPAHTANPIDVQDILYVIGRDNETEQLAEALATSSQWFMLLLPYALRSGDRDVRWQFAQQLGSGNFLFQDAESALLKLVTDDDEYVSRMALQALGKIKSEHAERLCERAWASGHIYQRIMTLWVLLEIGSPKLERYLADAKEDGSEYVVSNAEEILHRRAGR